jgi:hypothetical protein
MLLLGLYDLTNTYVPTPEVLDVKVLTGPQRNGGSCTIVTPANKRNRGLKVYGGWRSNGFQAACRRIRATATSTGMEDLSFFETTACHRCGRSFD